MYCNRCGTRLQQGTAICPECGARQHRQTRDIRCARCGGRASVEMAVCPHCGRNLVPAGPRWALWIPLALIVAFAFYWGGDKVPIEQVKQEAAVAQAKVKGLVQLPEFATPTATATQSNFVARAAQTSPTATRTPTAIQTQAPSATSPLTPSATPTAGPAEYTVVSGDSLALIGDKLDLPWRTIAAINGINQNTMIRPGDKLKLPTVTPGPTTIVATATPAEATVAPAATATSGLVPRSTATAEIATPVPPPTATPAPTPTPTPSATPAPVLAQLMLIGPGDGSAYDGENAQIMLQWQNKDYLPAGAVYRVTLQWTEKGLPVTNAQDTTATNIRAPLWLWGKSDQPARQYTWKVQIAQLATDGKGGERVIELNPPSETRTFYWK